jgi:hypothetical protein
LLDDDLRGAERSGRDRDGFLAAGGRRSSTSRYGEKMPAACDSIRAPAAWRVPRDAPPSMTT